jgi:hypothetical protein
LIDTTFYLGFLINRKNKNRGSDNFPKSRQKVGDMLQLPQNTPLFRQSMKNLSLGKLKITKTNFEMRNWQTV